MRRSFLACAALLAVLVAACDQQAPLPTAADTQGEPASAALDEHASAKVSPMLAEANKKAAAKGLNLRIAYAEYLTDEASGEVGTIVYANNRGNKQLAGDFVPALKLNGSPDMTYHVDQTRPSADLPLADTEAAIDRAMGTWDAQTCSALGMTKTPFVGSQTGFVSAIYGFGGSLDYAADVNHAGWLPGAFFDLLAEDGSQFILGVTFTLIFVDENDNPVDTDGNGKYDVAWREIYYNDAFGWNIGSTYDVETVALHEAGHGLSQAHFGKIFETVANGKIHFSPRAVMNAAYSGVQQALKGTDRGGHCSNWAQWPNN